MKSHSSNVNRSASLGFTLIELLVVLTIVALLATIAMPRYFQTVDRGKETILVENLRATRDAIDKFYGDRGRFPASLGELVEKKYLRFIPIDPITESDQTWIIVQSKEASDAGVVDLYSGASGDRYDGKPYSSL